MFNILFLSISSLINDIFINPNSKPIALNEWKSVNSELEGARQEWPILR